MFTLQADSIGVSFACVKTTERNTLELYPSIDKIVRHQHIYAYDKLDGSNIRAEWTRKNGFAKFGTRKRLLSLDEPTLGEAISLFRETYEDDLSRIFLKNRWDKATVFFEFYGDNSFAGIHADEPHEVTLFDVHQYMHGIMEASAFNKMFQNVKTAPILYSGNPTADFLESVKNGSLEGMTFEGVVCKGGLDKKRRPIAFKVKNQAWLDRLKNKCGDDESLFNRLA